ncbi:MAG: 16S rRNA (cytidine(1402)-2'-O)-methyltransferase, partial [Anaerolineaceae bacterium]
MSEALPAGLYITATPIGNPKDITLRAMEVLAQADAVICEEYRQGSTLLKRLGIQAKELIELNEHNEAETVPLLIQRLVKRQAIALISDCGTPVFSDPGSLLVSSAADFEIPVYPIPGASSLMAALSIMDFRLEQFFFAGFLPPKKELRKRELEKLKNYRVPIILMDTPYRLASLLEELRGLFGGNQRLTLACDLTLPSETIFRGTLTEIQKR